jgi:xanthine dehydrogenase accessory factor
MKKKLLEEIVKKKNKKIEFAIITNLENAESFIFEKNGQLIKDYEKYKEKINSQISKKQNGIIEGTNIFVETYIRPIKIIIVGAVHIAQYLINFAKSLNFEIYIIDPRGYFASKQRFPGIKIIKKWPIEAFSDLKTDNNSALIALTHDPKIDDPALQYALKNSFFYIGALGSRKTHDNRCLRLKEAGFNNNQIKKIFGPIGIKLGGRSAPEIALSIIAQLVSEVYKKK